VTTSETSEPTVQGAIDDNSGISLETGLAVSNVTQISSEAGHIDEVTKGIIADVQADYSNGRIAIDAKKS